MDFYAYIFPILEHKTTYTIKQDASCVLYKELYNEDIHYVFYAVTCSLAAEWTIQPLQMIYFQCIYTI